MSEDQRKKLGGLGNSNPNLSLLTVLSVDSSTELIILCFEVESH